jgi:nucleoside-diphosphate-sugar epimerase
MMDATLASGQYSGIVEFLGAEASSKKGKLLDNSETRRQLGWAPEWASYQGFMAAGAQDWYKSGVPEAR